MHDAGASNERRVIVDADACPSLNEIIRIARANKTPVVLVGNETQNLQRFRDVAGVDAIEVSAGRDVADYEIAILVRAKDIVITSDIGLASLVLAKEAIAISPRGKRYNPATIDGELLIRHAGQKVRRGGGRTKGPSSYTGEDKQRLIEVLTELLAR